MAWALESLRRSQSPLSCVARQCRLFRAYPAGFGASSYRVPILSSLRRPSDEMRTPREQCSSQILLVLEERLLLVVVAARSQPVHSVHDPSVWLVETLKVEFLLSRPSSRCPRIFAQPHGPVRQRERKRQQGAADDQVRPRSGSTISNLLLRGSMCQWRARRTQHALPARSAQTQLPGHSLVCKTQMGQRRGVPDLEPEWEMLRRGKGRQQGSRRLRTQGAEGVCGESARVIVEWPRDLARNRKVISPLFFLAHVLEPASPPMLHCARSDSPPDLATSAQPSSSKRHPPACRLRRMECSVLTRVSFLKVEQVTSITVLPRIQVQ